MFNLAFGPVEVALPLFVTDDLHAGPGLLGEYWAAFGLGAVVGALALGAARRLPLWPTMLAIIAGHGVGMLPFVHADSAVPSLIGFAFAGLVYGPYSALSYTLIQDRAPADSLTVVLAARSAVLLTAAPLGAASGGFLVDRTGAAAILAGCGVLMILIAVAGAVGLRLHAVTDGPATGARSPGRGRRLAGPVWQGPRCRSRTAPCRRWRPMGPR
jgi:predicted MFS family arabinose efflux permease